MKLFRVLFMTALAAPSLAAADNTEGILNCRGSGVSLRKSLGTACLNSKDETCLLINGSPVQELQWYVVNDGRVYAGTGKSGDLTFFVPYDPAKFETSLQTFSRAGKLIGEVALRCRLSN
ncbi:MAG: hypothetical protein EOP05_02690 [Proteobacteria bacterium]|nr:MAG: hypothetical protein EOP05_02690 [Pseudomonadota bacterium]